MEVGARITGAEIAVVARGGEVRPLPPVAVDAAEVEALPVRTGRWGDTTVQEVLIRHEARSLVVLHRGRLVYEWYGSGGGPDKPNRCYSVTKSLTGTLAAVAVHRGRLDRGARVGDLLPALAGSGFAGATVGDVADMTVAVGYDEDYADAGAAPTESPGLGFADYLIALGLELTAALVPPGAPTSIREFLPRVGPGAGEHGVAFSYATPVTDVLAWLLETIDGAPYPELLRDGIWSHIGAECDANVSLDPAGTAVAGGGLAVTTRDLARFGQFLIDQAASGDDGPVPAAVIESMRAGGDPEAFRGGHYDYLSGYTYRDQWWLPPGPTRPLSAWGIHGQLLWVDPEAELVVATHSGGPEPDSEQRDLEQDALCRALTAASAAWPSV